MKKLITFFAMAVTLLMVNTAVKGTIVDPCLMLHFDGVDGATSTIDSSPHAHSPINFFGNAQLDTELPFAGSASLMLDGNGDYLTIADSIDWDICTSTSDNWTIEFSVKHDTHTGSDFYIRQYGNSNNYWYLRHIDSTTSDDGTEFVMQVNGGSTEINLSREGEISDNNWHWLVFTKVGNKYAMYKDGTQVSYVQDNSTGNINGELQIGYGGTTESCFDGHLDEIGIFHDNIFGANPSSNLCHPDHIVQIPQVPEPATICLLGLGALSLIRRKR